MNVRCAVPARSPFASRTIPGHLARGAAGLLLLVWALGNAAAHPVLAGTAGLSAIVALRGCPMCWTIGLVETVVHRLRQR
jgi:hypothetical protein